MGRGAVQTRNENRKGADPASSQSPVHDSLIGQITSLGNARRTHTQTHTRRQTHKLWHKGKFGLQIWGKLGEGEIPVLSGPLHAPPGLLRPLPGARKLVMGEKVQPAESETPLVPVQNRITVTQGGRFTQERLWQCPQSLDRSTRSTTKRLRDWPQPAVPRRSSTEPRQPGPREAKRIPRY